MLERPPETFTLNDKELETANEWIDEHAKEECPYLESMTELWFGSPIRYIFIPCGIGTAIRIKCSCGEEENITDYDSW